MKVESLQTNFTAGEVSPLVYGRVDYAKYINAAKVMKNSHAVIQGPAIRRPGSVRVDSLGALGSYYPRVIPFVRASASYVFLLLNNSTQIYKNRALVATITTPWTGAQINDVRFAQQADAVLITHPDVPPYIIQYQSDTVWAVRTVNPALPASSEQGFNIPYAITLDFLSGPITITSASSVFLDGDVGRQISAGTGLATITAIVSGTQVLATTINDFNSLSYAANAMTLEDSPLANLTYAGDVSKGGIVAATASKPSLRTAEMLNKLVSFNGGVARVTSVTSTTEWFGVMQVGCTVSGPTPSGGWSVLSPSWGGANGYPVACTFFGGRMWFGGTYAAPTTIWGSAVNDYTDFIAGVNDASPLEYRLGSDRNDTILHMASSRSLVVLTRATEYSITGQSGGNITPTTAAIRAETSLGADSPAPDYVDNDVVFVQRSRTKIRAQAYSFEADGYLAPDISLLSSHLLSPKVRQITFSAEPYSVLWACLDDGTMASCCAYKAEGVYSWSRHSTQGSVRSITSAPTDGIDEVWAVVQRTEGGGEKLYLEVFDYSYQTDSSYRRPTTDTAVFELNVPFAPGTVLQCITDGAYYGTATVVDRSPVVAGLGRIIFDRPVNACECGYGYESEIEMLPIEMQMGNGTAQGRRHRIGEILCRVVDTPTLTINGERFESKNFDVDGTLDYGYGGYTGDLVAKDLGWERNGRSTIIKQEIPFRFTLLFVRRTVEVHS